jgi:hypothetical protein
MIDALTMDGQPPEAGWPYLAALPADLALYQPPPDMAEILHYRGEQLDGFPQVDAVLRDRWPVVIGLSLSMSFFKLD